MAIEPLSSAMTYQAQTTQQAKPVKQAAINRKNRVLNEKTLASRMLMTESAVKRPPLATGVDFTCMCRGHLP